MFMSMQIQNSQFIKIYLLDGATAVFMHRIYNEVKVKETKL